MVVVVVVVGSSTTSAEILLSSPLIFGSSLVLGIRPPTRNRLMDNMIPLK